MSEISKQYTLHKSFNKLKGFFDHFPLVTHTHATSVENDTIKKDVKTFYEELRIHFDSKHIYPLKTQNDNLISTSKTLLLSSLNYSSKNKVYNACTPEDTTVLKHFLFENKLYSPTQNLEDTTDFSSLSMFCIIIMNVNTLQIPLVIDNHTGKVIQDESEYEIKEEIEDQEVLKEYQDKDESDINDEESILKAYRSYSIILYLIILINVSDLERKMGYFDCLNENYLIKNNVFGLLELNKCVSLNKFVQLNMSRKSKFMMEISLKLWDSINYIFKKTDNLQKDIEIMKLKYSNYKILSKKINDEVVNSVIECVNNDDLLSSICNELEIKF